MAKKRTGRSSSAETSEADLPKIDEIEVTNNSEFVVETADTEPTDEDGPSELSAAAATDEQPWPPPPAANEYRTEPRKTIHVKAVVQFRVDDDDSWKEIVDITTISKNGAALLLANSCPIGRILTMALQMPTDMRVYDFTQDVYPMLGVVQNCSPISIDGKKIFHVGVAFIGKKMPDGHKEDPTRSYRITGRSPLGLWEVVQTDKPFQSRRAARFWRKFEVSLSMRDEAKRETIRQKAFTRDISVGGMSVWGPLDARIGDRVKVTSRDHDFYTMAVVRNRTEAEQAERTMVHFEFDNEFPIRKLDIPRSGGEETSQDLEG